ncbi:MAG: ATP-dependent protease ATPase subunit HslU [bacterium]|nr:ATP-dependent protease ATPase subunit HslU [bacterium]
MEPRINIDELSPRAIVAELDKYIVGQQDAKKAVALAVRNRVRRRLVAEDIQEEIYPKNIIMIGPTGCGKTEIARRLSRLTGAPFVKVEATKYTEVGYVGRDVESMIRDLVTTSINLVRKEYRAGVEEQAKKSARERILDLLLPSSQSSGSAASAVSGGVNSPQDLLRNLAGMSAAGQQIQAGLSSGESQGDATDLSATAPGTDSAANDSKTDDPEQQRKQRARELMAEKLDRGELEDREVEVETQGQTSPMVQVLSGGPNMMEDMDLQVQNMLGDLLPKKSKRRRVTIEEARKIILEEELDRLVDPDKVQTEAIRRAEQMGIVFVDEIDKICGRQMGGGGSGPDVSREGVQRDLLPIVEGATVSTRQGPIKTDHILFIAAGAFHTSKPSDLIPELQGRFPIRVGLEKLTEAEFRQILTGPRNSLVLQASALLETEQVTLNFSEDGLDEIAGFAFRVNEETENIGARRLHTIMEKLLEDVSFEAPELPESERTITVDRAFVQGRLSEIVEDTDTSRYIL